VIFLFVEILLYEEVLGFAPMAPDGRIGGNGAVRIEINQQPFVLVSKSGKLPGQMDFRKDFCLVSKFDAGTWECEYYSDEKETKPTSDTPTHYRLLENVEGAFAALHGHAIEKEEVAKALGIPCSTEETLFSTPADTKAMFTLLAEYPFPKWKIFVRKNHGFYILGKDIDECRRVLEETLGNKKNNEQNEEIKRKTNKRKKLKMKKNIFEKRNLRKPYNLRRKKK